MLQWFHRSESMKLRGLNVEEEMVVGFGGEETVPNATGRTHNYGKS